MNISGDTYQRLAAKAAGISEMAVCQFNQAVKEGKNEQQIIRLLLDLVTQKGGTPRSLSEMDDETFIRGLTNPTTTTL